MYILINYIFTRTYIFRKRYTIVYIKYKKQRMHSYNEEKGNEIKLNKIENVLI